MDRLSREQFLKSLREGLNHLQDPNYLRQSPLASLFGAADRFDTFSALQGILTKAIESLEPPPDEPPQSRAWRIYESLFLRYIQQLNQSEVAEQLGLGERQVRREQRAALEALADQLWDQFDLQARLGGATQEQDTSPDSVVSEELAWLKVTPPGRSTDLQDALSELLDLIQPLANRHQVRLQIHIAEGLPELAVHPVALNQALLNVLGVAFHAASGNSVTLSAERAGSQVKIRVLGTFGRTAFRPLSDDDTASLQIAEQLIHLSRGRLALSHDNRAFRALLTLPTVQQWSVLVIDDNADTLELLKRYSAGTPYRLVGTREPEQVLALAKKLSPQIILLDVMMPEIDGWKLMRQLRQHPLTGHIPLIICTILAQEELAFALGAAAYLRKPVTRQAFLAALDRQIERMETGSPP